MLASQPSPARANKWRGIALQQVLDGFGKCNGKLAFQRLERFYTDNTLVKPYNMKANAQGHLDYIPPITDPTIEVGSTPYPNTQIVRNGKFKRSNCGTNYLGGAATNTSPAAYYGGGRGDYGKSDHPISFLADQVMSVQIDHLIYFFTS